MNNHDAKRAQEILDLLTREYPDARLVLKFSNPLELLIATILAAQCRDERVNEVTDGLFRKCRVPADWIALGEEGLQGEIKSISLYRKKAKSIIACCSRMVDDFDGKVPDAVEGLTSLPGVGRKTANIVLGCAFGRQAIAVDTHVQRVSERLGLTKNKLPDKIEADLCALISESAWTRATLVMGAHGRAICHARKPDCPKCVVRKLCPAAESAL
ncbi:MAG TPA: endonuclease III [Candidatus Brocadiia bacterium]|nr:endonuclease III [Candidatus Brocadiia bacterium]